LKGNLKKNLEKMSTRNSRKFASADSKGICSFFTTTEAMSSEGKLAVPAKHLLHGFNACKD